MQYAVYTADSVHFIKNSCPYTYTPRVAFLTQFQLLIHPSSPRPPFTIQFEHIIVGLGSKRPICQIITYIYSIFNKIVNSILNKIVKETNCFDRFCKTVKFVWHQPIRGVQQFLRIMYTFSFRKVKTKCQSHTILIYYKMFRWL